MGQVQSSIPQNEYQGLIDLFRQLNGEKWRRREGWTDINASPEGWHGIEISLGHVTSIELPANNLHVIPSSIGNFTQLRALDLSKNQIVGQVPLEVGALTKLKILNLSCNDLQGT
ncbi:unnamed protein product [Albugo candida]|uniref:Leucine-rich repeat-containing N-terminal plant-type domain-containing protein n=1 Tax=Albugo candida TaxID=65357 RepID=A0A024GMK9_9STRA|nr:unnamed protein product [Albugo candida]|eukprot:CCI48003.1 unnamed protein product [Albugo candida]